MALWGKTKTGVKSVTLMEAGTGYTASVAVEFTPVGLGGTGAAGSVLLNADGSVNSVRVTAAGSGYTAPPTVTVTGGGTGASAYAALGAPIFADGVPTGEPTAVGRTAGEWVGDIGEQHIGWSVATVKTGTVSRITLTNRGIGYTAAPLVVVAGSSGAAAVATLTQGVEAVALSTGGSGYTAAPTVVFGPGGISVPVATAVLTGDEVTAVNMVSYGTGYTFAPTVSFVPVGTGGSGAAATSALNGTLSAVTVTNAGAGYTAAPAVSFDNEGRTGGSGAAATAIMSDATGRKQGEVLVAMNHSSIE